MLESDAKKKWCPFTINNSCNRNPNGTMPEGAHCLGSKCAVWEWNKLFKQDTLSDIPSYKYSDTKGQCGLIR